MAKMIFVDTHAHIFFKDYNSDRDAVVARAAAAGVAAVFDVGLDIETNREVIGNAQRYESVFAIIGFHPHEAKRYDHAAFAEFLDEAEGEYVGIGEFGLDYYRDHSPRRDQRAALEKQLELCAPLGRPLIFHCRQAEVDMMSVLRAAGAPVKGVMHCFSGDVNFLKQTLDLGLHISVGGPVTYKNNERLIKVLKKVPADRLLLETDCPFLTPHPQRGKRNEPANIPAIAEAIAAVRGETVEQVAEATTRNAAVLFGEPVAGFLMKKSGGSGQ